MKKNKELSKDDKINLEIERLTDIFSEIDEKKKKIAESLICESAFMKITLQELKNTINEEGTIDEMCQGEYTILREHPSVKVYNTMVQRYTNLNDKLLNLLPKEVAIRDDGFDNFLNLKP